MKWVNKKARRRQSAVIQSANRVAVCCEALEERQLMSLTVDVRAVGGAKVAQATAVGQVIPLQVWATVTGVNGNPAQDGLADVMGSFISSKYSTGSVNGNLNGGLIPVFNNTASEVGKQQDLNGDGNLDLGSNTYQGTFNYFFVRAGSIQGENSPNAVVDGGSLEFLIATLTYKVTSLGQGGETDINFIPAGGPEIAGIWSEDGISMTSAGGQGVTKGVFTGGAPMVITDAAIAPAPVGIASSFYAQQGYPTRIAPLAVDTSVDSLVPGSVTITAPPADGIAVPQADGSVLYTSTSGYTGTDSFSYTVTDLNGQTSNQTVVTMTVGTTASPVAGNVAINAPLDGFVDVPVLSSDSAAAGVTLVPSSVSVLTAPQDGTAVVQSDGSILYTPNTGYTGQDSFLYTVDDSLGHLSNPATVTLTVARAAAPMAGNITTSTGINAELMVNVLPSASAAPGLSIPTNGLAVTTGPSHGMAYPSLAEDGTIVYQPNSGFTGIDTFSYTVSDNAGTVSAPATITVYVTNGTVVLHPVASNDSATVVNNSYVNLNLLANDTPSTFSSFIPNSITILTPPAHGTLGGNNDGTISYIPAAGYSGSDSFTYTAMDYTGQTTNVATVNLTVLAKLTGTVIGTPGSYHNLGNTISKVFDGSVQTFFDAPTANGNWVGLDLGKAYSITQINYAPRAGWANRMVGGVFQGSNDPSFKTGVVALGTVVYTPQVGAYTTVSVSSPTAFRYVRYLSPNASYGNIAEMQLFGQVASPALKQLTGTVIGTTGSYQNQGNTIANVFDGNLSTFFDAPTGSGAWVGLDLGTAHTISQLSFAPRTGFAYRMVGGMFQASNTADFSSGVVNLYTVTSNPPSNTLTTVTLNVTGSYRYVRYIGPANACCNISELVFYG